MSIGGRIGQVEKEWLPAINASFADIFYRLSGEEVDGVPKMFVPLAIFDDLIVVERLDMTDLHRHPFPEIVLGFTGNTEMMFSD